MTRWMPAEPALTHPERVYWPDEGYTKHDLVEYYRAVSKALLPHLRDRPLTVKRYPGGITGETFFQKNAPKGTPGWVSTVRLPAESAKREVDYVLCNDLGTLVWLGNQGAIELHPWISRVDRLEKPDALILDIDPPEGRFDLAVRTALATHEVLQRIGIEGCVKTSGAKGLHVYVPLERRFHYAQVHNAAFAIASRVSEAEPGMVTAEFKKVERGGRVFLDYTRTRMGQHVVAPYSPRARAGAPVSFPVRWQDLERCDPAEFTIRTAPRLLRGRDPWGERCPRPQRLPRELLAG